MSHIEQEDATVIPHYVIVGAGMAGIAAAKRIQQHFNKNGNKTSVRLTILEARDRIGGRIHTTQPLQAPCATFAPFTTTGVTGGIGDYPLDFGAQFVHYHMKNPLYGIARDHGIEMKLAEGKDLPRLIDPDGQLSHEQLIEHGASFEKFLLERMKPHIEQRYHKSRFEPSIDDDEPFPDTLNKCIERELNGSTSSSSEGSSLVSPPLEMNDLVRRSWMTQVRWLAAYNAADPEELGSASFFYGIVGDSEDMTLPGGMAQIVHALAADLPIMLNHEVFRIELLPDSGNRTRVHTTNGKRIECDKVLVTVPLGVLKRDKIQFVPPLPQRKQDAIRKIGYGSMSKVFLEFDQSGPWFTDPNTSFSVLPSLDGKVNSYYILNWKQLTGRNILIAFCSGTLSKSVNQQPDWLTVKQVMTALRVVYPSIPEPRRFTITKWDNDPFSYGAYGYSSVGCTDQTYRDYEAPVSNTIYFGGEATSSHMVGYAHGAYYSGIMEAEKMLVDSGLSGVVTTEKSNPILMSRL